VTQEQIDFLLAFLTDANLSVKGSAARLYVDTIDALQEMRKTAPTAAVESSSNEA
jgi:hypothetical protein